MTIARRNPSNPQRRTAANARKTEERIDIYLGKQAILRTWEKFASDDLQIREHDYLIELRARVRMNANLIAHRADPKANVI